jgi:hypothetical protein
MHEWFTQIVEFVADASIGRAIVFALLAGLALTQWVKFQFPDWLTDKQHARRTRTFASLVSFAAFVALAPDTDKLGVICVMGAVIGMGSPFVYWLVVKILYHFWPWLDDTLSARPGSTT